MLSGVGDMSKFLIKYVPLGYLLHGLASSKCLGIVLVLAVTMFTTSTKSVGVNGAAQKQSSPPPVNEVRPITSNDVVQRNIEADATHAYQLTLRAQQFARIIVDQK